MNEIRATHEEKLKMYMSLTKGQLAEMLIEANKHIYDMSYTAYPTKKKQIITQETLSSTGGSTIKDFVYWKIADL